MAYLCCERTKYLTSLGQRIKRKKTPQKNPKNPSKNKKNSKKTRKKYIRNRNYRRK